MVFPAVFNLSSLNGKNGFAINGTSIFGRAGYSITGGFDFNTDGYDDIAISAPFTINDGLIEAGTVYLIYGNKDIYNSTYIPNNLNGTNGFIIKGTNNFGLLGYSVKGLQDINGDGIDDIVLGAPGESLDNIPVTGAAYVIFGSQNAFSPVFNLNQLNGANGFKITGGVQYQQLGYTVSSAGDFDGDGYRDLLIGAPAFGSLCPECGFNDMVILVYGRSIFKASYNIMDLSLEDEISFFINDYANGANTNFGAAISSVGDMNGDKIDDISLLATLQLNNVGGSIGFVIYGSRERYISPFEMSFLNSTCGFTVLRSLQENYITTVSGIGDINNDTYYDIALGIPFSSQSSNSIYSGEVFVIFGANNIPFTFDINALNGTNGFYIEGIHEVDCLGSYISGLGDVNGDGISDFGVSAVGFHNPTNNTLYGASYIGVGATYIILGKDKKIPFPAEFDLNQLNCINGFVITSNASLLLGLGYSLSSGGDFNQDGKNEIFIGSLFSDTDTNVLNSIGQAYIVMYEDCN